MIVANPDENAEVIQILAVTDSKPENAHCQWDVLDVIIECNDNIVEGPYQFLDVTVEINAEHIQIIQCNERLLLFLILIIGHVITDWRGIDSKQSRLILNILVHNITTKVGTLHVVGIGPSLDKGTKLI